MQKSLLLCLILLAVACGKVKENPSQKEKKNRFLQILKQYKKYAVLTMTTDRYDAGAIGVMNNRSEVVENLSVGGSDHFTTCYKDKVYKIQKFQADKITSFDIENLVNNNKPNWEYSTLASGETGSSNPYNIVFESKTRAFIPRYGKNKVWVVNPSAKIKTSFKLSEIDLTRYADDDGLAEVSHITINENKLFIGINNVKRVGNDWQYPNNAKIIVLNLETFKLIKEITLAIKNIQSMQVMKKQVLVAGADNYYSAQSAGAGIQIIDAITLDKSEVLLSGKAITAVSIGMGNEIYIKEYLSFGSASISVFNTEDKSIKHVMTGDFSDFKLVDQSLWVLDASATDPGIIFIETESFTKVGKVTTELIPRNIEVCSY